LPVIKVVAAYEGALNNVKTTINERAKDIALVRFLKKNSDVFLSNIALAPKKLALRVFIVHYF